VWKLLWDWCETDKMCFVSLLTFVNKISINNSVDLEKVFNTHYTHSTYYYSQSEQKQKQIMCILSNVENLHMSNSPIGVFDIRHFFAFMANNKMDVQLC